MTSLHANRLPRTSTFVAATLLAAAVGCGSSSGETAATGGAGGTTTGGAGGTATGGAGGTTTGGAGGTATGGMGGATGGMGGATGGMGGMAMGGAAGGTGAPITCKYAAKDNPNKAEVSYMITGASADANLMRSSYTGEARVLVTYVANPAVKLFNFSFAYPFLGLTPTPCVSLAVAAGGSEQPAVGKTLTIAVSPFNPVTVAESPACSPLIAQWNGWSLAGPGTVTFTKVDGPNIEFDFSFPMGPKLSNMAAGSYTITGKVKSPCYFVE